MDGGEGEGEGGEEGGEGMGAGQIPMCEQETPLWHARRKMQTRCADVPIVGSSSSVAPVNLIRDSTSSRIKVHSAGAFMLGGWRGAR